MQQLVVSFISILLFCTSSVASDHIDGAATIEDGQADLTDLYAFPTPNNTGSMSIILNTYPGVKPTGHFSSKVSYDVQIRLAEKNLPPKAPGFSYYEMDACTLTCDFKDPSHHTGGQGHDLGKVSCNLKKENQEVTRLSGDVGEILSNQYMRLFTGPRTDAFFISSDVFLKATGRKGFSKNSPGSGDNAMDTINVMTIAVELDLEKLNIQPQMFALAAQSYTRRDGVKENLDRVGRPEIINLSLHDYNGNNPLKAKYNAMDPFSGLSSFTKPFKVRLMNNISAYDGFDGKENWSTDDLNVLADILVNDFLVIDMTGSCNKAENVYFSIEKAMLLGLDSNSCGGRQITDDIMATLYGLYIAGPQADLDMFETGVTVPYQNNGAKDLSSEFPYIAEPGDTSWKQWLLFKAAKFLQE